ncbi:hypothetical protein [Kingella potus]|nr:hypothetical protein [Kingella potus]UOP01690.1 hypothetical protein LVJ84_06040 [Kingella potus]
MSPQATHAFTVVAQRPSEKCKRYSGCAEPVFSDGLAFYFANGGANI